MATLGRLLVELGVDASDFNEGIDSAQKKTKGFASKGLGGLKKAVGGGLVAGLGLATAGIVGLGAAMSDSVQLARVQRDAERQLAAVLKSTGGAAGLSADELKNLASELQGVTNYGDEATIQGESLLLTFTNIGKEVFPRATETMLDMSTALGQDMKSSAIQLGKALNDPIKGVSALQRVGVSFTEQQKEQIATMVEAGDVAGAQTMILDELAKEFGGSARAMADPAVQLSNAWGDFKEVIGGFILPLLDNLTKQALPLVNGAIDKAKIAINELRRGFEATGSPVGALMEALDDFLPDDQIQRIWSFIDGIVEVKNVVATTLQPIFDAVASFVSWKDVLIAVGAVVASIVIPALISILATAAPVIAVAALLIAGVAALRHAWENNFLGIRDITANIMTWVSQFLLRTQIRMRVWWERHGSEVIAVIRRFTEFVRALWQTWGDRLVLIVNLVWALIQTALSAWITIIQELIAGFIALVTGDWEAFGESMRTIWETWLEAVRQIFVTSIAILVLLTSGLVKSIQQKFTDVDWGSVGGSIIEGIKKGVLSAAGALASAAAAAARRALDAAKAALGIHSPSRVFMDIGAQSMAGLALGIMRNADRPAAAAQEAAMGMADVGGTLLTPVAQGAGGQGRGQHIWNITINAPGGDPDVVRRASEQGVLSAARSLGIR